MKTIFAHIEDVKAKPHHIRKRVAFGAAASVTIGIALVWFVGSLSTGEFALKDANFAVSAEQAPIETVRADGSNLAGAAAALEAKGAPAHLEVINTTSSSSSAAVPSEKTTIPF